MEFAKSSADALSKDIFARNAKKTAVSGPRLAAMPQLFDFLRAVAAENPIPQLTVSAAVPALRQRAPLLPDLFVPM